MKIVIYFNKLNIGGAERSTMELANGFCRAGHDVTMFVGTRGGKLETELLPEIKLMYFFQDTGSLSKWNRKILGLRNIPFANLLDAAVQYGKGCMRKIYYRLAKPHFDLGIISFNGFSSDILNNYTNSSVRIKIIRSQRCIEYNGVPAKSIDKFKNDLNAGKIDSYVCVSQRIKTIMQEYCSIDSSYIHAIYNLKTPFKQENDDIMPVEYEVESDCLKILTVCRLHEATKGLLRMVDVAYSLRQKGHHFKWFIVGDGPDRDVFLSSIHQKNLDDVMVVCGFRKNPRAYYKFADLVAVLSYVEGFCGAVTEAKMFEKPIIVTHFTVDEQIKHLRNGYIVENDTQAIEDGMERILIDDKLRESLAVNLLSPEIMDNDLKIKRFEELYERLCQNK